MWEQSGIKAEMGRGGERVKKGGGVCLSRIGRINHKKTEEEK